VSYQSDIHPRHSAWQKLRHTLSIISHEPANLLAVLLLGLFSWIILAPVISVLLNALLVQSGDEGRTGATEGTFTAYYLLRTLSSRMSDLLLWTPLLNTLAVALSTVAIALVVGIVLAWLVNRTDIAGRKWFATLLIVPFMLPSWTFALAWSTLFKNHAIGGQPGWLEAMGIQTPNWMAYGYFPIVTIMVLHYAPLVILIVGNALKRMDSQMEECAQVLGASRRVIAFKIIIPLVRPALLSAALLIFADCIGEFALPYILGLPVHFDTLSTGLYRAIGTRQSGVAAVIAAVIMLMGMLTLLLDMKMLREAKRFVTLGGKGVMERRHSLGRWRSVATALPLAFVLLGVAIPLLTLFLSTVMILPGRFSADNFTLDYWIGRNLDTVALHNGILLSAEFWHTVWNTLVIVGSASLACGVPRLRRAGPAGGLRGAALPLPLGRRRPASADLPALSGAGYCLRRRLFIAVCRGPRAGSGAVWHPVDPDPRADCRKNAVCQPLRHRGDDPAWERGRGSGADCRCRLVRPPAPYRHPDSGRAAGDRDPAAVYLRD